MRPTGFTYGCGLLAADLAAYKNPGFQDEREVRLVRGLDYVLTPAGRKLVPSRHAKNTQIQFRIQGGAQVPYVDYCFGNESGTEPIKEVIIGPKNKSKKKQVVNYLESLGIVGVLVKKSSVPYR